MRDLKSLIEAYLDGELSTDETAELSRVLADSKDARRQFWMLVRHDTVLREVIQRSAGREMPIPSTVAANSAGDSVGSPRSHRRWRESVAWLVVAACLLLALLAWTSRVPDKRESIVSAPPESKPREKSEIPKAVVTLAQQRDQLLHSPEGVLHIHLAAPQDSFGENTVGDIVWSTAHQKGFLRLRGLAKNDPKRSQYQLWIVESGIARVEAINGGVFNVDQQTGEIILPIQADHFVRQPKMFVISIEPPGGSLDLTGGGVPLLAKVDDGGP